jgi:undecaprenyl-diphosphatase
MDAFKIGCFQCLAMIPGVSRSGATIVGGMSQKMSRKVAAEFSFFLAVPTMLGATLKKTLDYFQKHDAITADEINLLILGNIVAFIVAVVVIKGFIAFLNKHGFRIFGWYRIIVGSTILLLLTLGIDLQVL